MDLAPALKKNEMVLVLVPGTEYSRTVVEAVKGISDKKVCYVTINKTFEALQELFSKNGVDTQNIVFIDAISKTFKKMPDQTKGCYFVSAPNALTELSIAITKLLRHGFEYVVFDSLSNLLIYQKGPTAAKFVSNITTNIRSKKTKALFFALCAQREDPLITQAGTFVDKVIDTQKTNPKTRKKG